MSYITSRIYFGPESGQFSNPSDVCGECRVVQTDRVNGTGLAMRHGLHSTSLTRHSGVDTGFLPGVGAQ